MFYFIFFSSRRRHTIYWRDWSSDVCSSDLGCHVGRHQAVIAADLFQLLVQAVHRFATVAVAGHDGGPVASQSQGDRPADTAGSAGHERVLASEFYDHGARLVAMAWSATRVSVAADPTGRVRRVGGLAPRMGRFTRCSRPRSSRGEVDPDG